MDKNNNVYWCVSPLDFRYYGNDDNAFKRLEPYVSEESFIKYQLKVEQALAAELEHWKVCSHEQAEEIIKACNQVTANEVYNEEKKVHHNVRALVYCIQRKVSESARPYVHLFATSNDILDTANALRLKELTSHVIVPDLIRLQQLLISQAKEYADLPQIGRTHGKHAEPITYGFFLANYVDRLSMRIRKVIETMNELRGMFSGAVGAYNAISLMEPNDPALFEVNLLSRLGLRPSESSISTQVIQPEYVTDLAYAITSCFSVLANLADDIRHLHRTEIQEVQEIYQVDDVGSSTMPHKVNPRNFEHVKSMWKEFMPRMVTRFMDQISEHQRDLTNSASSRFLIEMLVAFDYSVNRMESALNKISVYKEKMRENLESNTDRIIAEPLYILLAMNGFSDAYNYVRTLVKRSIDNKVPLSRLIWEDEKIKPYLSKLTSAQKEILRDPTQYRGAAPQRTRVACDLAQMVMETYLLRLPTDVQIELVKEFPSLQHKFSTESSKIS